MIIRNGLTACPSCKGRAVMDTQFGQWRIRCLCCDKQTGWKETMQDAEKEWNDEKSESPDCL